MLVKRSRTIAAVLLLLLGTGVLLPAAHAARAKIPEKTGTPYLGAIVLNADTGEVVMEENADANFYPASIVKLMVLLVIQEKIEEGALNLSDPVTATAEASKMGGSQVYLAENEVFPLEDLLYALIIQSANDAAVALAIHVAGSKDAFVELMNQKAKALGIKDTEFHSVHGLPPAPGQKPDVSTPRDMAVLSRELLKHQDISRYTSTQIRNFRDGAFEMRSHNRLLGSFDGCNGLKTGYFRLGGFSIAASAARNGNRLVAVVAGAKEKDTRDASARKLLARAFSKAHSKSSEAAPEPPVLLKPEQERAEVEPEGPPPSWTTPAIDIEAHPEKEEAAGATRLILIIILIVVLATVFFWLGRLSKRGPPPSSRFLIK